MASGLYGADVAQLRALGARLDQAAAEIERAGRVLAQDITTTTRWQGPDASLFRNLWSTSHHPQVASATAALRAAARTVRRNADQQEQASRADGGTAVGAAGTTSARARQRTVKAVEALVVIRKALDTGGLGVTRSDMKKIRDAFAGLTAAERAEVVESLTDPEIAVLRDQMQESGIKGGMSHSEQAALYRSLASEPQALRRLLGKDWPTATEGEAPVRYGASSDPAAFLRTVVNAEPGKGQISIYETVDGKYVVNLRGIEDGPTAAVLAGGAAVTGRPELGLLALHQRNTVPSSDSPIVTRWATQSIGDDKNWAATWENPYAASVRLALQEAGVPPGADVMLVGHSFGAYTAMELATDPSFNGGYVNVKTVVAMAADVDFRMDDNMPAGTSGLVVNNALDVVAKAESLQRQNESSTPSGWREVTFVGGVDGAGHGISNYSAYLGGPGASQVPAGVSEFMGAGTRTDYKVHDIYR